MHKTGESIAVQFCVSDPATGGLINADALPTAVLILNGVDHAAVVTVTTPATGIYRAVVTLPTVVDGDELQLRAAATVATVAGGGIVWHGEGVTARPAEVLTALAAVSAALSALATANVGVMTVTQSAEPFEVNELSSAQLSFTVLDQDGVSVSAATLESLTLTLYDLTSGTVINSREDQDALNANEVTVAESGVVTWSMLPTDNVIVWQNKPDGREEHRALFRWIWDNGAKAGCREFRLAVKNIKKLPVES